MDNTIILILIATGMFAIIGGITVVSHIYNLNEIKSKTVGDGQHGTARFANRGELKKTYKLKISRTPLTTVEKITYKSSNSKIASVNSQGMITARKKGTATITILSGKKKATVKVTVK